MDVAKVGEPVEPRLLWGMGANQNYLNYSINFLEI